MLWVYPVAHMGERQPPQSCKADPKKNIFLLNYNFAYVMKMLPFCEMSNITLSFEFQKFVDQP